VSDDIRIDSAHLRSAAQQHQGAADYLRGVPATHPQIESFLSSLGPIFGDFKAAGGQVLDARKQCYDKQADDHEHVTSGLHQVAAAWDSHEQDARQQFRGLTGGGAPQ